MVSNSPKGPIGVSYSSKLTPSPITTLSSSSSSFRGHNNNNSTMVNQIPMVSSAKVPII